MTRRYFFAFAAAPFCGATAQTGPARARSVMDGALAALGGQGFLKMEDRLESGRAYSFYRERLSGLTIARIYTRYLSGAGPGQLAIRERQSFGKSEESAVLFTEDNGYEITFRGARPLADDRLAAYRYSVLHNIFYILRQRMNEPGLVFDSRGSDIVDNQPVEIVDITDDENRTVTVYFNQNTKLPSRQVYQRRDPKTGYRTEEVTLISKYRDVGGGVMWPFAIERVRDDEKIFQIFSDSVVINQNLRDDLFTLPSNMKVLTKK